MFVLFFIEPGLWTRRVTQLNTQGVHVVESENASNADA